MDLTFLGEGKDTIKISNTWYRYPMSDYFSNQRRNPIDDYVDMGVIESDFVMAILKFADLFRESWIEKSQKFYRKICFSNLNIPTKEGSPIFGELVV
jgi:hypothetical protein